MSFEFNPFTSNFDYYKDDYTFVSHNSNAILTSEDLKKVHVMDVAGGERAFWLFHADTDFIGQWICLMRKGVGNLLRIWANGTDIIFNSTAGGYIECTDTHDYSCIFLWVIEDGVWGNPSFGIWSTH